MTPIPRHPDQEGTAIRRTLIAERCSRCGRIVGPKHRETCDGPPAGCGCPPGYRHERGCLDAYWPEDAA